MSNRHILSPYEIAFRHACSKIAILDHGQNDLLQRISHVRAWRQQQITQLTQLMHTNSPISRLPNETLALIFETVHEDAIDISHVSRRWRNLALRLPFLWKNIRLSLCIDQIREYLARSQPLSLAITFDADSQNLRDKGFGGENSDDEDLGEIPSFMARLTMFTGHVSRWRSFHVDCTSPQTMFTILGCLRGLSAPSLIHAWVQLNYKYFGENMPGWHVDIFNGGAPLLCTVRLRDISLSNCSYPLATTVELELDTRVPNRSQYINFEMLVYMPNLRVLDIRGSDWGSFNTVCLPMLERLTWGYDISLLFRSIVTPALRYLRITPYFPDDLAYNIDVDLEDFADAITHCPRIPILPKLDELRYDYGLNYAADCIFVGLPGVTLVRFPLYVDKGNWELCSNFFKALTEDSSRWPHLATIVFVSLPPPLFDSLRDFVIARSSEEHRLTIRIEGDPVTSYSAVRYYSNSHQNAVCAEDMMWLQEHVNVEIVPPEYTVYRHHHLHPLLSSHQ